MPGQTDCEVLIVGAGPTGLVLALWLTRLGVRVRIIDKAAEPGTTSRALAVQARTLELYRQLDLDEAVVALGHKVPAVNLWTRGRRAARLRFEVIGERFTRYAFLLIFPQDAHERLLGERLAAAGVQVERRCELLGFEKLPEGVEARVRRADTSEAAITAAYIAGCDGARSRVRETIGAGFPGGTYDHLFYVADLEVTGPVANGELHVDLDQSDFLASFPLDGGPRVRLVGSIAAEAEHAEALRFEDVSRQAIDHMRLEVGEVNWFSTYRVHHRVAARFRAGRAFLLGDAAHVHSPVGGQGMNTGIGDAINLAWKLAWVLRGKASEALLASYEPERIAFARRLVASTDRGFTLVTAKGAWARFVRTRLVPPALGLLARLAPFRDFVFRTVSQVTLNYRAGPLARGIAGQVRGGDRLPWVAGDPDNFAPLSAMAFQVHVYGAAGPELSAWCAERALPLHVFAWSAAAGRAGLARDAAYLVRPDGYVALADSAADPAALDRWFAEAGVAP